MWWVLCRSSQVSVSSVTSIPLDHVRNFLPPELTPVVGPTPLQPESLHALPVSRMDTLVRTRVGKAVFDPDAAAKSMQVAQAEAADASGLSSDDYW